MPGVMPLSTDQRTVASDLEEFATDVNLSDDQKNKLPGILARLRKKTGRYTHRVAISNHRLLASNKNALPSAGRITLAAAGKVR
jgi:hypothetical protein